MLSASSFNQMQGHGPCGGAGLCGLLGGGHDCLHASRLLGGLQSPSSFHPQGTSIVVTLLFACLFIWLAISVLSCCDHLPLPFPCCLLRSKILLPPSLPPLLKQVVAVPDSGFLINYDGPHRCQGYEYRMKQLWEFMPSITWAVPQECIDNLKEDAWKVGREEGKGRGDPEGGG